MVFTEVLAVDRLDVGVPLLDTLAVGTVLVPVAVKLGDSFWWPRRLRPDGTPPGGFLSLVVGRVQVAVVKCSHDA